MESGCFAAHEALTSKAMENYPDKAWLERLHYRRQFIFGPRSVNLEGLWRTHSVAPGWVLTAQQDLPVYSAQAADGAWLWLVGFMIDPETPELREESILHRLAQCLGWEQLLQSTLYLSGRWVLFYVKEGRGRVVSDATALRSVYYAVAGEEPWCFSQPGLYRRMRPLEYDPAALEFVRSRECQRDFEACWPAASSPYREVAHLLSNHYLELERRKAVRFWPTARLEPMELEPAVTEAARILRLSMQAITARGTAAFAITAGRDSRTLLAASRAVADRLWVYTAIHTELNLASPDLRISAALCQAAGVTHHLVRCPQAMSEPFASVFMNNDDPAHRVWGGICQGLLAGFPPDRVAVRGNVSEAARCVFYPSGIHPAKVDGLDLARRCKMPPSAYVREHFDAWLADATPSTELGYKLLDLFFLEHRMPKWLAVSQTQYDIVHDTFSPYSNRRLLMAMWSVPPALRIKPQSTLYRELIRTLWPELLPFPFNPPDSFGAKLLHKVRKAKGQVGAWFGWRPVQVRLEGRDHKVSAGKELFARAEAGRTSS